MSSSRGRAKFSRRGSSLASGPSFVLNIHGIGRTKRVHADPACPERSSLDPTFAINVGGNDADDSRLAFLVAERKHMTSDVLLDAKAELLRSVEDERALFVKAVAGAPLQPQMFSPEAVVSFGLSLGYSAGRRELALALSKLGRREKDTALKIQCFVRTRLFAVDGPAALDYFGAAEPARASDVIRATVQTLTTILALLFYGTGLTPVDSFFEQTANMFKLTADKMFSSYVLCEKAVQIPRTRA